MKKYGVDEGVDEDVTEFEDEDPYVVGPEAEIL